MFREFWAQSTNFGQNGGWDESRGARGFCVVMHATFGNFARADFHQNWRRNVIRWPVDESGNTTFSQIFTLGVICPKIWHRKSVKQVPHSEQATGHGMHCREMFTLRCSQRARKFQRLHNVFARRTVTELQGVKIEKFSDFGLFSPYKTPKTYLPVTSLQPRGYIGEWLRFFHVVVEGPKRCLLAPEFSCWGLPTLPKFSPMANGYSHTEC